MKKKRSVHGLLVLSSLVTFSTIFAPVEHTSAHQEGALPLLAATPSSETGAGAYMPNTAFSEYEARRIIQRRKASTLLSDSEKIEREKQLRPEVITVAPLPVQPTHQPWNQRGVFLTHTSTGDEEFLDHSMDNLRTVGGNAIIFDVKGSMVHFDAQNTPLAKELGLIEPQYNVQDVIQILHKHGIYAIGRYIAVKDYGITNALPETNLKNPKTGHVITPGWIDPANADALEYNRQIICELATNGIDEINLDYIRYDTRIGEVLTAFTGEERIAKIEEFVRMARNAINECGPHTKLGLSTFAIIGWDYDGNVPSIGQDVVRFAPLVDVISPMAYNANFAIDKYADPTGKRGRWNYLVYRTLTGYAEELGPEHAWKLRPWLQGWGVTADDLEKQIQGAFDGGACGFLIWNADNAYTDAYNIFKKIHVPDRCRGLMLAAE